jgi:hypothetical protein
VGQLKFFAQSGKNPDAKPILLQFGVFHALSYWLG